MFAIHREVPLNVGRRARGDGGVRPSDVLGDPVRGRAVGPTSVLRQARFIHDTSCPATDLSPIAVATGKGRSPSQVPGRDVNSSSYSTSSLL